MNSFTKKAAVAMALVVGLSANAAHACWVNVYVTNNTGDVMSINHFGTQKKGKKAWLRLAAAANACWLKPGETCQITQLTARKKGNEFKTRIVYRLLRQNKKGNYHKKSKPRIAESALGKCKSGSDTTFHAGNRTHFITVKRKW